MVKQPRFPDSHIKLFFTDSRFETDRNNDKRQNTYLAQETKFRQQRLTFAYMWKNFRRYLLQKLYQKTMPSHPARFFSRYFSQSIPMQRDISERFKLKYSQSLKQPVNSLFEQNHFDMTK